jgi:hypothetical protein
MRLATRKTSGMTEGIENALRIIDTLTQHTQRKNPATSLTKY